MSDTAYAPARFKLPTRIRSRQRPAVELESRVNLIDRIADLQGIQVAMRKDDAIPCRVDVHLAPCNESRVTRIGEAALLCSVSRDGITVHGLDRWARYQVLARRWGGLNKDSVLVYLPRDDKELETVWQIIRRAYDNRQSVPEADIGAQVVSTRDVPIFSRTSLQ
jgi:hypothetical protein